MPSLINKVSRQLGIVIKEVNIDGISKLKQAIVTKTIGNQKDLGLFGYDVLSTKKKIDALPWVYQSSITKIYPNRLKIQIKERLPSFLLEENGSYWLMDRFGYKMDKVLHTDYPDLALIVGEGSQETIFDLNSEIERYPNLKVDLRGCIRVGRRRWDLLLKNGMVIKLSEDFQRALSYLEKLDRHYQILKKNILSIDLRILSRITVQVSASVAKENQQRVERILMSSKIKNIVTGEN